MLKNAVAAKKIEVVVAVLVVEICALGLYVNAVKADGSLDLYKRRVQVLAMEIVVLAHAGGHERFKIEGIDE